MRPSWSHLVTIWPSFWILPTHHIRRSLRFMCIPLNHCGPMCDSCRINSTRLEHHSEYEKRSSTSIVLNIRSKKTWNIWKLAFQYRLWMIGHQGGNSPPECLVCSIPFLQTLDTSIGPLTNNTNKPLLLLIATLESLIHCYLVQKQSRPLLDLSIMKIRVRFFFCDMVS